MLNGNQILPAFGSNNIEHLYCEKVNKVGFYSGKNVWHWFYICKDGTLIFDHSYSQNTGKTKKGFLQSKVAERLANKFSILN